MDWMVLCGLSTFKCPTALPDLSGKFPLGYLFDLPLHGKGVGPLPPELKYITMEGICFLGLPVTALVMFARPPKPTMESLSKEGDHYDDFFCEFELANSLNESEPLEWPWEETANYLRERTEREFFEENFFGKALTSI